MNEINETAKKLINEAKKVQGKFILTDEDFSAGSVGAALITEKGNLFTGICIDLACGIGFCAEHSAVAEMLKTRETRVEMVVAVSKKRIIPPCGRCRELLIQINTDNKHTKVILSDEKIVSLNELLPYYWNED